MRLIDADELYGRLAFDFEMLSNGALEKLTSDDILETIHEQPTVDPVKHGRWIYYGDETIEDGGRCSVCGGEMPAKWSDHAWGYVETDYCPHCGTRMDGDAE